MRRRRDNVLNALQGIRQVVVRTGRQLVVARQSVILANPDAVWEVCRRRLQQVLLPADEYARLLNRLANSRAYYRRGERYAALYEVTQAYRRVARLRRLYA